SCEQCKAFGHTTSKCKVGKEHTSKEPSLDGDWTRVGKGKETVVDKSTEGEGLPSSSGFAVLTEGSPDMDENHESDVGDTDVPEPDSPAVQVDHSIDKPVEESNYNQEMGSLATLPLVHSGFGTQSPKSSDCQIVNEEDFPVLESASMIPPGKSGSPSSKEPLDKNQSSSKKKKK
ncbi:hypothetical protein U1Q18_017872, partial [Sarracenia purpurea var. burkii]